MNTKSQFPTGRAACRGRRSTQVLALCGVGALALGLAGTGGLALAQTFRPLDLSGVELFERYCAACHGSEARGDGPVAGSLNKRVPDLTRLRQDAGGEFPAQKVRDAVDGRAMVLAHGTRLMPVWGYEFWVEEGADIIAEDAAKEIIARLVAYLESVQLPGESPPDR